MGIDPFLFYLLGWDIFFGFNYSDSPSYTNQCQRDFIKLSASLLRVNTDEPVSLRLQSRGTQTRIQGCGR